LDAHRYRDGHAFAFAYGDGYGVTYRQPHVFRKSDLDTDRHNHLEPDRHPQRHAFSVTDRHAYMDAYGFAHCNAFVVAHAYRDTDSFGDCFRD
jgi:hypothetical protein